MVRKIQVPHVDEYLRCPLLYRYRRELGLPFLGNQQEEMLLTAARHAVGAWFNALGKGQDRRKAREKVGSVLHSLWSRAGGDGVVFPLVHARIMAVLLELDSIFDQKSDSPIAGALKIDSAVSGSLFEDVIDGLYLKNDLKPEARARDKTLIAVQVVSKFSIASPRVSVMRRAMVRHAINSAMRPNPYPIKLVNVSLPDATKKWYDLRRNNYEDFLYLARSVIRHLDAKHYLPTADSSSCRVCPYNRICTNHFCEPEVSPQLVGRARNRLLEEGV